MREAHTGAYIDIRILTFPTNATVHGIAPACMGLRGSIRMPTVDVGTRARSTSINRSTLRIRGLEEQARNALL